MSCSNVVLELLNCFQFIYCFHDFTDLSHKLQESLELYSPLGRIWHLHPLVITQLLYLLSYFSRVFCMFSSCDVSFLEWGGQSHRFEMWDISFKKRQNDVLSSLPFLIIADILFALWLSLQIETMIQRTGRMTSRSCSWLYLPVPSLALFKQGLDCLSLILSMLKFKWYLLVSLLSYLRPFWSPLLLSRRAKYHLWT